MRMLAAASTSTRPPSFCGGCAIENNVASECTPYGHGGGAYFYQSSALLEGNTFRGNQASTPLLSR